MQKALGTEEVNIDTVRERLDRSTRSAINNNEKAVKLTWNNLNYKVRIKDPGAKQGKCSSSKAVDF